VQKREAFVSGQMIREGDLITIDGSNGNVYFGEIPTVEPEFSSELNQLLSWADEVAYLRVMANADTPEDAARALRFGARGIGLCRTERMFNAVDRLPVVIEMIVAETAEQRQHALDRLLPIQRSDFRKLFETMSPLPVTIRLLDPPIHEFLPGEIQLKEDIEKLQHLKNSVQGLDVLRGALSLVSQNNSEEKIPEMIDVALIEKALETKQLMLRKVRELTEVNPMLGHRGVRLGITYPEIYRMQIRAILEAEAECAAKGIEVHPQMMVPQVCSVEELKWVREYMDEIKASVQQQSGQQLNCRFGTMIEVVRACMRADSLAGQADFFSFGTNDLTQATFSFSREDAENKFLPMYNRNGILKDNPFEVLDEKGVGKLMQLAMQWGREVKPDLSIGICGEHGGHPASIEFCQRTGLNYVSCSAPRVPVARLAAAHALLKNR
jgi:pyruvate,orthophosphate dikinase